jgi:hypothetical protein
MNIHRRNQHEDRFDRIVIVTCICRKQLESKEHGVLVSLVDSIDYVKITFGIG